MIFVGDVQDLSVASHLHNLYSFLMISCNGPCLTCIQEDGYDEGMHQSFLDLRVMLLSFNMGFNLVSAAVVWAILERISGLEPSSVTSAPRYLNFVTVSSP